MTVTEQKTQIIKRIKKNKYISNNNIQIDNLQVYRYITVDSFVSTGMLCAIEM